VNLLSGEAPPFVSVAAPNTAFKKIVTIASKASQGLLALRYHHDQLQGFNCDFGGWGSIA
jgi:hypothetical protein